MHKDAVNDCVLHSTTSVLLPAQDNRDVDERAREAVVTPTVARRECAAETVSPCGHVRLCFREEDGKTCVDIWEGGRKAAEVEVPGSTHGALLNDGYVADGPVWLASSAVAYVAEVRCSHSRVVSQSWPQFCTAAGQLRGWGCGCRCAARAPVFVHLLIGAPCTACQDRAWPAARNRRRICVCARLPRAPARGCGRRDRGACSAVHATELERRFDRQAAQLPSSFDTTPSW